LISAIKNGENLDDLIDSVASKGGTTEAGLNLLREKGFTKIFSDGVNKGIQRAKELS
jgi:pyrroline-5-carboxylate reductase